LRGAGVGVGGEDGEVGELRGNFLDKCGGAGGIASADEHAFKVARQGEDGEMGEGEASGAENAERGNIGASQKFCGYGGSRGGAQVGEVVGGDGQAGLGGVRIEE